VKTTIREIAQQAQVHHGTVSIVLNGTRGGTRVSEETRRRVLGVAEALGYQPNRAAQQLKTRRSNVVGLLVGDLENPFFARLVSLCTAALADAGFDSVLAMRRQGEVSDMHHLQALASRQVDGLIVWIESDTEIRAWLNESNEERNLVVLGHNVPGCDSVGASLTTGTRNALTHLIEQGCRRIAYLAPESSLVSTGDPRPGVYSEFMEAAGQPIQIFSYDGTSHSPEAASYRAEEIAHLPPDERPDALFCFNDLTAIGALIGVRRGGLEVPRDIAIVGCDGLPLASLLDVPITSIVYPLEEMCREAVALLRSRLEENADPERIPMPVRHENFRAPLAIRASSKRLTDTPVKTT
jgi:LacI family transcriptional regulator